MDKTIHPPTFDTLARDKYYWDILDSLFKEYNFSYEEILRNWQAFVMRRDIPRFLSHYELFKRVLYLPGCIVELGVSIGVSFFTWAHFLEILCPYDRSRKVFGFDHFQGLADFGSEDGAMDDSVRKMVGGYKAPADVVRALVKLHNSDNMVPNTTRCALIEGDILETLPRFLKETPGLKISLLHFDMDLYKPTKAALEWLYPLVVTGGVVCFDEYGLIPWQGETKAVDEFFETLGKAPVIRKHAFAQTPHGYFVKE